jgi:hypothetical protein
MFNQPTDNGGTTGGGYFKPADNNNDLILFTVVKETGTEFDQMSGRDRDFVIVDYANLDRDAVIVEGAKVTHGALVRKLAVGATNILGRIGQTKTSNGYTAWVLNAHTPEDAAAATAWITGGKPAKVDPFASLEREAATIGVTVEQLLAIKKLGGTVDSDAPKF